MRQFLDDVQFEVGNQISDLVRDIQRDLRDEFTDRLGELQRTYTDTAQRGPGGRQRTRQAERKQRQARARQQLVDAARQQVAGELARRERNRVTESAEPATAVRGRRCSSCVAAPSGRTVAPPTRPRPSVDAARGPLRVAIAGRVKAGKSTLLNALVGERLAPTDAGECTRHRQSWYRTGPSYEVERHAAATARPSRSAFKRSDGALDIELGGLTEARRRRSSTCGGRRRPSRPSRSSTRPGLASLNDENSRRTARVPRARRATAAATPTP